MSGLESVMNFFRPAAAQTPATELKQLEQTPNGTQATAANPAADPTKLQGEAGKEVSPLDNFANLWEPKKPIEGEVPDFDPSNIFKLNQESMATALAQVDFTKGITEEQVAAIQAGGPEALKALGDMLNNTARQTMGAATQASAKMIESALTGASGAMDKKITTQVRSNQIASHLQEVNPALSHPAAAPMINALQAQLAAQFPKASPQEITQKVTDYMTAFAGIASGKPEAAAEAAKAAQGTDWEKYYQG